MHILQLLDNCDENALDEIRSESPDLLEILTSFREYVNNFEAKLGLVLNLFQYNMDLRHTLKQIRSGNRLISEVLKKGTDPERLIKNINQDSITGKVFTKENLYQFSSILASLYDFIRQQIIVIDENINSTDFNKNIETFVSLINEEASVLFCNVVLDSFEFMDALEKKLIVQINKEFVKVTERQKYKKAGPDLVEKIYQKIKFQPSAQQVFEELLKILKRELDIRCMQVLVRNPDSGNLEVKLFSYVKHLPMYDVAHEGGIISNALESGETVCINNVFEDSSYDIFDATIKSELAVPLYIDNEPFGVLNLEDVHSNRFDGEFVDTIQVISYLVSQKIKTCSDRYKLSKAYV